MAKRKTNELITKYGTLILLIISLAIVLTALLPAVIYNAENSNDSYNGFEVMFGKNLGSASLFGFGGGAKINFSILAVLGYLLPIIATVICVFVLKKQNLTGFITCISFIASCILLFLLPSVTSVTTTLSALGGSTSSVSTFTELNYVLGIGSVIGALLSIIGILVSALHFVSKK